MSQNNQVNNNQQSISLQQRNNGNNYSQSGQQDKEGRESDFSTFNNENATPEVTPMQASNDNDIIMGKAIISLLKIVFKLKKLKKINKESPKVITIFPFLNQ